MPRVRLDGGVIGVTNNPTSNSAGGMWSMKDHEKFTRSSLWPAATSAAPSDTYFNRTTLLLHGDGSNNANNTVFVDSSTSAITLTTNGKPLQGTYSPFSQTGWSNYFNGSSDYLSYAGTTVGTNIYTFECWFNINATQTHCLLGTGNIGGLNIRINNTLTSIAVDSYNTSAQNFTVPTISLNTWYHLAVTRNASNGTDVWLNGVKSSSGTITLSTNYSTASNFFGRTESIYMAGFVSNARLVIGTALYTAAFTPSTTPLTAVSNTVLLICQDNRFKDNSTNAYSITSNGTPSVQPFSPFAPSSAYSTSAVGGSISFNGSTDYLSGSGDPFGALSGNFTVEFWVYKNDAWSASSQMIFDAGAASSMGVWVNTGSGTLRMSRSGVDAPIEYSYSTLTPNQWYHIAFVRSSATLSMYVNGNRVNTVTSSASFATGTTFNIGRNTGASQYWNGYISNFRAVKGSAVYDPSQTTITVPASPLTAVASTSLLLNATNAGIIDHTAKNVITTAAGANISTTQSKYGGSSISLSGTSTGYLQMLNTRFNNIPASTDFTLECWLYTTASSTAPNVWHNTSSQRIIAFYLSDSGFNNLDTIMGPFSYPASNASVVRGTTNIVANTWTHVAFVRSGSTITVYVDGTACGTGTSSYASLPLQLIGAISTGATTPDFYFFPGYIDDLRLTIGVARYTSNFTPKTTAFEDQ